MTITALRRSFKTFSETTTGGRRLLLARQTGFEVR